jgi:hypothetical protein
MGAYVGIGEPVAWSSTSLNQRFALSYVHDGWNLTATSCMGSSSTAHQPVANFAVRGALRPKRL